MLLSWEHLLNRLSWAWYDAYMRKGGGIKTMQLPKEVSLIENYNILKWDLNVYSQGNDKREGNLISDTQT